jgi:hypothetical protein
LGYKSREKKRRQKAKQAAAAGGRQRNARKSGSSAGKHWLTLAERKACCNMPECGTIIGVGGDMVYRHKPQEVFCLRCADRAGLYYRPSLRWERASKKRRRRQSQPIMATNPHLREAA